MRVLFLDIDGVMNSQESCKQNGSWDVLMPHALAWLKKISDAGVKIVVSSTWRKHRTIPQLVEVLGVPVHDVTPVIHSIRGTRGQEIAHWCSQHLTEVTSFAIIDDDSDMLDEQMPFFVHTDTSFGWQELQFKALCKLLEVA